MLGILIGKIHCCIVVPLVDIVQGLIARRLKRLTDRHVQAMHRSLRG
jgi:hypothetical protein